MADHSMLHELWECLKDAGGLDGFLSDLQEAQIFHVGRANCLPPPRPSIWQSVRPPFHKVVLEFDGAASDPCTHEIIYAEQMKDGGDGFICWVAQKGLDGVWIFSAAILGFRHGEGDYEFRSDCADTARPGLEAAWTLAAHVFDVLRCVNVETRDEPAPTKLNAKRVARGKVPLFSYKTLSLAVPNIRRASANAGGTHASPRVHLRRGHIRQLSDDRAIWVQPCVVGSKHGLVQKDYRLVAKAAAV